MVLLSLFVAVMVLTSAADGTVKVFHCGLNVHPFLQQANTFDRMGHTIHKISATSKIAVSLSADSRLGNELLVGWPH